MQLDIILLSSFKQQAIKIICYNNFMQSKISLVYYDDICNFEGHIAAKANGEFLKVT